MKQLKVFVFLVVTVGFCALLGSVAGAAFGSRALFVGGYLGGVLGIGLAAWLGGRLRWVATSEVTATAIGTMIGFLTAATIAMNTLRSPVGPILSTLLIGVGGIIGSLVARRNRSND